MPYITVPRPAGNRQITFEDILFDRVPTHFQPYRNVRNDTVTIYTTNAKTTEIHMRHFSVPALTASLRDFNRRHAALFEAERDSLYHTFYIPKKKGGYRRIDEPLPELMEALRELKVLLETQFEALHHTAAFAYVRKRSTIDDIRCHQRNQSHWFLKTDFENFFGSATEEFVWNMIFRILPYSELDFEGECELKRALSLAFLNGGLPQGTPLSPTLTNLIMIPIDHYLTRKLRERDFVYTRYADDILISHKKDFDYGEIVHMINDVLGKFQAPFRIKTSKTRYGSSSGRNWNLGVMLNKNNEITIGHRQKDYLKSACHNYVRDRREHRPWDLHDIAVLNGKISYYRMVEPAYVEGFISHFNKRHNVNLMRMIRADLKGE